ncbi:hypothetical protein GOP47_0003353 [Adiantum capillus-veneris]|uniref:Uncharacterized protein n=1 Tax=Adiantum capillus-veneris TaxID=13818 RepID=A0A9D4VBT5_ADICA|nr:hypothetical protein GOP47_0002643 [Adiantum capillus-veneris]KAI5083610.1 hypothetical protein GOP47_0003353 [Adiantum capillus-veneris]
MTAVSFRLLLLLLLPLSARADIELHSDGAPSPAKPQRDPALLLELHSLKSQYQDLEESSLEKDLVIHDKEKTISALRVELENLKKKESLQYDNVLTELGSKVTQLEDDLKRTELELQDSRSKAKTLEAAQSLHSSKIKQLEKVVAEQKKQIGKAEQALRAAEATLLRVQQEADAKDNELRKVHGGWLPPWTSMRLVELQAMAVEHWSKYGQPLVDMTVERASEKMTAAQKWTKPHLEKLKTHAENNWAPAFRSSVESVSTTVSPHFETARSKLLEGYQASKDFVSPHLNKAQVAMEPHIQVAREACRPYVEEAASLLRPYYEKAQSLTKPYSDKFTKGYRRFLTSATAYHKQLQESMKGKMEKVDFLAVLATSNEFLGFLSAALLVLPPLFIFMFLSSALAPSKKPVRSSKGHHGGHSHKRAKRAKQADK